MTSEEDQSLRAFIEQKRQHGLEVDLVRGQMYQMTADSVMLDHRPDYAKVYTDGLRAFTNRMEQTGTESQFAVEQAVGGEMHVAVLAQIALEHSRTASLKIDRAYT